MDITGFDFIKYSRDRLPRYRVETAITSGPNGRRVRKRALTEESKEHVRGIVERSELLKERFSGANVQSGVAVDDAVLLDFIEGRSLEDLILERASAQDRDGLKDLLSRYVAYISSLGEAEKGTQIRDVPAELLEDVPIESDVLLPAANLDMTFDNLLVDANGRYWITDIEWVYDSPIPRSFLTFRAIYVLFLRHGHRIERAVSFQEALLFTEIPQRLWEPYRLACEKFIDMVFGDGRPHTIPDAYLRPTHRLASLSLLEAKEQELFSIRLELEATKKALGEMLTQSRMLNERLHDQERRLGEHSDRAVRLENSLADLQGKLGAALNAAESERLLRSAAVRQAEQERDHALHLAMELGDERSRIIRMTGELDHINSSLSIAQATLDLEVQRNRAQMAEVHRQLEHANNSIIDLIGERDENFVRLQNMTERFMGKQAELMTMSDWARSMQLRLEFLESIPAIGYTERMARSYKQAVDKLRSEGPVAMLRSVLLKVAPQQVQGMLHRQEPSNMGDLKADAEGRDVLVVFPVIPWEFRWQRPQQLVSRFAAHGYTVLFVNMTITPRGSRYINDLEALKEVRLGKLKEHIFELHLSSFNKINVYQDRIKGADLNNVAHGLLSVLRDLEPSSITYLVQFPGWGQLANLARARVPGTLVFDCMDDHAGFSNNATEVVKRETKLMEKADLVVTSSAKLQEKALAFNDNTLLVRNGTDFEMFHQLRPNGKLDSMRRPIIGYHGAISEWFDPEVVFRCAQKHPEWNFVLIGSTLGCHVNGLKKLPNVHLLGEMPYRELPGYLHYFDVCVIPFKVCELTLATNPVKFYEYISSGKPVVSVRLPEMEQYADICYLYRTDEEFERGIVTALGENDPQLKERRVQVARESSWDHRFQEVQDRLSSMAEEAPKRRKVL